MKRPEGYQWAATFPLVLWLIFLWFLWGPTRWEVAHTYEHLIAGSGDALPRLTARVALPVLGVGTSSLGDSVLRIALGLLLFLPPLLLLLVVWRGFSEARLGQWLLYLGATYFVALLLIGLLVAVGLWLPFSYLGGEVISSLPKGGAEQIQGGLAMSAASAEQEVLDLFHRIRRAMLANDADTLRAHVAEDYRGIDAGSAGHDREVMLDLYGPGGVELDAFEVPMVETQAWAGTVLVSGKGFISGSYAETAFEHRLHFLDVYADRGDGWKLVASHVADVADVANE